MRAMLVSEFGGPEQLRPGRAADPVAGPGQVRIRVHAAGVNPVDAGNRADGRWAGLQVPCILGYDVACIDYTCEDVASRARALAGGPVDAIGDLVGGRLAQAACTALRPGGQIAAIATPELALDPLLYANITFHGVLIQDDGTRTRALAALLDRRALQPVLSHVLPLEAAAQAHRILEGGHTGGKIVLDVTSG